ncbi:MAG TPA: preprotein translocase subunit YajC [Acidimicrobiales bacterium]|jgi:preprotein translocase subunit YajC|nr:preprotein translocase subunit YajC [Acidimicrobiales bacterium]
MLLTILAADDGGGGSSIVGLLPLLALPALFYFLLIRPQRRRMKEQQALLSQIEEGDEVQTTAGILGFVTAIEGDIVWLEIAEGVDVRINRGAIARKVTAPAEPEEQPADEDTDVGESA